MQDKFEYFRLRSETGCEALLTNFGARLMSLRVPDRDGIFRDVLAGFDRAEEYVNDRGTYFGAVVGRVANRIGGGRFELDGRQYRLALNDNGVNHLHGGNVGFDKRFWKSEQSSPECVTFSYTSPDGEEGYPGELRVEVKYELLGQTLEIEYSALSDADTLCALTNHAYFNLDGDGKDVREHEIFIDADSLTVVDKNLIPTGERLDLTAPENAAYSFLRPHKLADSLGKGGKLTEIANGGYDFSYNFRGGADGSKPRATAYSEKTGIRMSVFTDLESLQFYTGNFLTGFEGKAGQKYDKYAAFCMETQCDIADIERRTLKKGEKYRTITRYAFEAL